MKYRFYIVVSGKRVDSDDDMFEISDLLYSAGCDDSTVNSYNGTLYLTFNRVSDDFEKAVLSAIKDIESIDTLKCLSVDLGDTVSLSDVAEITGAKKATLSRYNKRQRGDGDFPSPILRVDSSRPLWNWLDIAQWLEKNDLVDHEVVNQARVIGNINTALQIRNTESLESVQKYLSHINYEYRR